MTTARPDDRGREVARVVSVGLDRWAVGWMNRRYLTVALRRRVAADYIVHPGHPRSLRELGLLPGRRLVNDVTVWDLPCWMNPDFASAHGWGWLARGAMRRYLRPPAAGLQALLLWHPGMVRYLDFIPADVAGFYADDLFEGLARDQDDLPALRRQQAELLDRADVVFVSWRGLAERLGVADRATILPHGVEFERYAAAGRGEYDPPADLPRGRPIVGYTGTVNTKVDLDLLEKLAQRLADWNVVLVGNKVFAADALRRRFERLLERENVFHLGIKGRDELPAYVQGFDVCMMCYRLTRWTEFGLPLKLLEYFATGKPVVSTYLPSLEDYARLLDLCRTHEEFIDAVAARRDGPDEARRQGRIDLAAANTWDDRAETVLAAFAKAAGDREASDD